MAATFWAHFDRIAPAANKHMATLFNAEPDTRVLIHRIWAYSTQLPLVSGAALDQELWFITARTPGTAVVPVPVDSAMVLGAGITADHASTGVTVDRLLMRFVRSNDEIVAADTGVLRNGLAMLPNALIYESKTGVPGFTLRPGRGISIKNITTNTVGSVSYIMEFSVAAP